MTMKKWVVTYAAIMTMLASLFMFLISVLNPQPLHWTMPYAVVGLTVGLALFMASFSKLNRSRFPRR
jgi:uncharacterized membrane protein